MKKSYLFLLLMIVLNYPQYSISQNQLLGKWIIPTSYGSSGPHKTQLAEFYNVNNSISIQYSELNPLSSLRNHCQIGAGAYDFSYNLEFYILDEVLHYGSNNIIWNDNSAYPNTSQEVYGPEFQIINRPGCEEEFLIFYIEHEAGKNKEFHLRYKSIDFTTGIPSVSNFTDIVNNVPLNTYVAYALTNEENDERYMYTASKEFYDYYNNLIPAGVCKWTVTQSGVNLTPTQIINVNNSSISADEFSAYNLEMKYESDDDEVIAWITNTSGSCDKVYVVVDGNEEVFDLNLGRIGGIEFSTYEPNIIYVSTTDEGIIKLDYTITSNNVTDIDANDDDYSHTFLQIAPDGHLYGVSDDGLDLAQIDMSDGTYTPAFTSLPNTPTITYYVSTYRIFDSEKYFILPENQRLFNFMTLGAQLVNVCPGAVDGSATIYVDGGYPPYTYLLEKYNTQTLLWDPIGTAVQTMDEYYTFTGLSKGEYRCHVTDNYSNSKTKEFEIIDDLERFDEDYLVTLNSTNYNPLDYTDINERAYRKGIKITGNTDVVISNCHFTFGKYGGIFIEKGSSLTVDNSTLDYECEFKWRGIEIEGDDGDPQRDIYGNYAQGRLVITNESVISNAENAVSTYICIYHNEETPEEEREILWNTSGGVVQADDSYFVNNAKAIHFIPYQNYIAGTSTLTNDMSYFRDCSFTLNENYLDESTFYKHIDLNGANGIKFKTCAFSNTASNGVFDYNNAIGAYSAKFKVSGSCEQQMVPCPEIYIQPSTFSGFFAAVYIAGTEEDNKPYEVSDSEFENNTIGIFVSVTDYGVIIDNDFEVGSITGCATDCAFDYGIGIDMHESNGFAIEGNSFIKYSAAPVGQYTGVRVYECPSVHDIIYNNTFEGLSYGNYAYGVNRADPGDDGDGVEYQCNDNTNNSVDFIVTYQYPDEVAMIREHQGSSIVSAGNTFTDRSKSCEHFRNDGTQDIDYYYCDPCPDNEEPIYIFPLNTIYFDKHPISSTNSCSDHYTGIGGVSSSRSGGSNILLTSSERQQEELDYNDNLNNYNSVHALFESLKDGGNTPNELSDVQNAFPDDMWTLRGQLLGHSPHLSQDVLRETSDRTDVFPDDVLLDILSANPDELTKDTLLLYLEQKEDPLPDYMIDVLYQLTPNITYKTILKRELADYHSGKSRAAQNIIRSIVHDSLYNISDYKNWLNNMGGIQSDKQLVSSYLSEGDITSATSLLNSIPTLYNLEGEAFQSFNDYKDLTLLKITWKNEGKNIFQIDSADIGMLHYYADSSSGTAKAMARNILSYTQNIHYSYCTQDPDSNVFRSHSSSIYSSFNEVVGSELTVEPNPANTWVAFNYSLNDKSSTAVIRINDIFGKMIDEFNITGYQGQYIWDCRNVKSGTYIYTLITSNTCKSGKIIVR